MLDYDPDVHFILGDVIAYSGMDVNNAYSHDLIRDK